MPVRAWLAALCLLLAAGPAGASEAERTRLQRELHDQAARSAWEGVERTYRTLVELGLPLSPADHVVGHQSALRRGDALLAALRLARIPDPPHAPADEAAQARSLEQALLRSYGLVAIVVVPPRLRTLEREEAAFSPHQQAAVERAARLLHETGEARGLLPVGTYRVADRTFRVEPGAEWQTLVVSD